MIGRGVLFDARHPLGAWNRSDIVTLREQPGQGHLRRCRTRLGGNRLYLIDDAQVEPEVLAGETRVALAPVVCGELLGRANVAGQEAMRTYPQSVRTAYLGSVVPIDVITPLTMGAFTAWKRVHVDFYRLL